MRVYKETFRSIFRRKDGCDFDCFCLGVVSSANDTSVIVEMTMRINAYALSR